MKVSLKDGEEPSEAIATTFEDALAFDNLQLFRSLPGTGLITKFREATTEAGNVVELAEKLRSALCAGQKAEFALDLLFLNDADKLRPPAYIADGLKWLEGHLVKTKMDKLFEGTAPVIKTRFPDISPA